MFDRHDEKVEVNGVNNNIKKVDTNIDIDKTDKDDVNRSLKSLEEQISDVEDALVIFFQNRFTEVEEIYSREPNIHSYLYYKIGFAYKAFLNALLTMEWVEVNKAWEWINGALALSRKLRRKKYSWSSWFSSTVDYYNDYSDEECHAEVIYAEATAMSLLLSIVSSMSFVEVILAPFKLRAIYNSYQLAGQIAKHKTNWKSETMKVNFTDAVGAWGFINILLSHLPDRVNKILSFVGYDSDPLEGFTICRDITLRDETYRAKIFQILICFYALYMSQITGVGSIHLDLCDRILSKGLTHFPESVFYLFFRARLEQTRGNVNEAIQLFTQSIKVQNDFTSLHNVATWDLTWCYALKGDWAAASECAKFLEGHCNWGKPTNIYQWACFQYIVMEEDESREKELLPSILDAMKRVPEMRKRYLGKTLPYTKFAITKSQQLLSGRKLHLPVYELFYVWNIFSNTGGRAELLDPIMERLDRKIQILSKDGDESLYVMLLLKGVCLRNYGRHEEAIDCFNRILNDEKDITEVTYIPPHAAMEVGITYLTIGKVDEAKSWLHRAKNDYRGFLVESLAHLRIHQALCQIKH